MNVAPGSRLGPYEIIARIGAGGMGEVWKARDTRLDRGVAIKILSVEFAQNEQLRLRFEREARTISQLSHPHICALYDVGENYLVMELLDGESVADRVAKGAMPLNDVLRYGAQVADALDRAHRAGIVHRDLKPGNIMITKSGAKLLDFGLAKSAVVDLTVDGATQRKPLTQEGTIVGTFQYMAPEQLEGVEADSRTDIFAFGSVLYEMATGRRAFEGKTKTSLIAAIVKENPRPIAEIQPLTPPAFEHVVVKCLAKDPDDRWQSAHDIAEELRWISEAGSQAGVPATLAARKRSRGRWIALSAAIGWTLAVAAAIAAAMYASRWRAVSRVTQTEIAAATTTGMDAPLAISPDGRRLAAAVVAGNTTGLWLRDLSTGEGRTLAGTEGATFPFWAPDGHAIGFFAGSKLKTVNAETGAIQNVCDALYGRGGTWSPLGVIVFAPNIFAPLMKVSENGGKAVAVTKLTRGQGQTHRNPVFLPDGKHFLYCDGQSLGPVDSGELHAGSIDGGFDRKVLDYASNAAYVGRWLLTIRDRNLIAQRFDLDALEIRGKPVAIAQNIEWYRVRWQGTFAVGGETLVYEHAAQPKLQLLRLDALDVPTTVVGDAVYYSGPALSPDGRRVILNRFDAVTGGSDLWMYDLGGGPATRLTFDARGFMEDSAVFAPDGERIAVAAVGRAGPFQVWIQPAGGGTRESLKIEADYFVLEDWSPDGKTLLVTPQRRNTSYDVDIIHLDGDRKSVPLVHGDASEMGGRFSPNGKWIAYQSDESGRPEVYVTNYPAATAKWQVSTGGGLRPFWSADGRQLFFLAGDRVVVVAVHEGESFSADAPRPVEALGDKIVDFAVARNGRIVALREIDPGKAPLSVVLNWQELLRGK
jgi:eukaryotic-like serine/threonine-protein kinase